MRSNRVLPAPAAALSRDAGHRLTSASPLIAQLEPRLLFAAYSIVDLGALGADSIPIPQAINASGQVVGLEQLDETHDRAVLWSAGQLPADLGSLVAGRNSRAWDINDAGQVVGESVLDANNTTHAFLWTPAS